MENDAPLTDINDVGAGNGSTFTEFDDYIDMADQALDGLCYHARTQVLAIMALENPALFRWALTQASIGC